MPLAVTRSTRSRCEEVDNDIAAIRDKYFGRPIHRPLAIGY